MKVLYRGRVWGIAWTAVLSLGFSSFSVHVACAQGTGKAEAEKAGVRQAEADPRAADRAGIRKSRDAFTEAFQKGDANAAAAHLTTGASLTTEDGNSVKGRENIQKAIAAHFSKSDRPQLSLEIGGVEFPSRDTAIEEGIITTTTKGPQGGSTQSQYQILYVREDGKWFIASIHEQVLEKPALEDLSWIIGTWSAKRPDAEVLTTYEWFGNKSFIVARFTIREKSTSVAGMQLIGTDPASGLLRTWTFEADGGFGEGTCVRDGKQWIFETETLLTDSGIMSASNILVPIDANSFTWQPINLAVNGEEVGNLPPVKVTRVESKK